MADTIDAYAFDFVTDKLRTPLQIEMHLDLAFEAAFPAGTDRYRLRSSTARSAG